MIYGKKNIQKEEVKDLVIGKTVGRVKVESGSGKTKRRLKIKVRKETEINIGK